MCLFYAFCTSCIYVCSCLCALRPHKHLTHFGLHLVIPVGQWRNAWKHIVAMTGGGFLGGAQMGFHMGARSHRLCGVDSQTLPCQGAVLCPGVYLPPCCCFVSPGLKLKRLLLLIIMQRDLGGGRLWKLYYMVNVCRQLNI